MPNKIITLVLLLAFDLLAVYGWAQDAPPEPETAPVEVPAETSITSPLATRNPFVPQMPFEPMPEIILEETPETTPGTTQTTPGTTIMPTLPTVPTGPIIEKEKPIMGKPNLNISGILWNSDRPQAIVNGNIVEIGDKMFKVPTDRGEVIEQLEFVAIDRSGVSVSFKDKTVVINTGLDPLQGAQ